MGVLWKLFLSSSFSLLILLSPLLICIYPLNVHISLLFVSVSTCAPACLILPCCLIYPLLSSPLLSSPLLSSPLLSSPLLSSPLLSSLTVLDAVLTLSVFCFDVMSSFICSFYNSLRPLEMRSTISIQCQVRVWCALLHSDLLERMAAVS